MNGPTKQAPWITFNGVNHGDSQVESIQDLNFILEIQTTVKLGDKERFDKEQIGVKEPFSLTNCQFTS